MGRVRGGGRGARRCGWVVARAPRPARARGVEEAEPVLLGADLVVPRVREPVLVGAVLQEGAREDGDRQVEVPHQRREEGVGADEEDAPRARHLPVDLDERVERLVQPRVDDEAEEEHRQERQVEREERADQPAVPQRVPPPREAEQRERLQHEEAVEEQHRQPGAHRRVRDREPRAARRRRVEADFVELAGAQIRLVAVGTVGAVAVGGVCAVGAVAVFAVGAVGGVAVGLGS